LLVVDDEQTVRAHIVSTLSPEQEDIKALEEAGQLLFGESPAKKKKSPNKMYFEITQASSGYEAVDLVSESIQNNRPFATVFCDMSMPGMDGLETLNKIRSLDSRIDVVILTAYTDYSPMSIMERLDANISYLSKPFSAPDLFQMAARSVLDWNKTQELDVFMETLVGLNSASGEMDLLKNLSEQLSDITGIESLAIFKGALNRTGLVHAQGTLADVSALDSVLKKCADFSKSNLKAIGHQVTLSQCEHERENGVSGEGSYFLQSLGEYGYLLMPPEATACNTHQCHLAKVMIEYTAIALKNLALRQDLAQKLKMAEIGKTASYICHDIRAPIALANMLVSSSITTEGQDAANDKHKKILAALKQAESMANDILLFANNSMCIEPKKCRVHTLVRRHQDLWMTLAQHYRVPLTVHNRVEPSVRVEMDQDRLARAITNLVKNAAEAVRNMESAQVSIIFIYESNVLKISVTDNGCGIPPVVMDKIFQPFVSTTKAHGSGFGLAIAKEIIELHHGDLQIASNSDDGTCCTLIVPDKQPQHG
jgi:C4-dicarboxylate-specific signal transduction histidine kinase